MLHREDVNCHGGCIKADVPTAVLCQANFAVLYLPFTSLSLKLPDNLHDLAQPCRSNWMSSREQSARRIDGESSSQPGHAVLDQFRPIPRSTEAQFFIDADFSRSNRVMNLSKVDIPGAYPSH